MICTGRSDFPNQVNNVLGFPYIFRGALDVRATAINEQMKIAAVKAIAEMAKKPIPEAVNLAYNTTTLKFGREYIIPKPMDPRLITEVSSAVARAAIESGVARKIITDWDAYTEELRLRVGSNDKLLRNLTNKARQNPKRIVFAEADTYKILRAAQIVKEEKIAVARNERLHRGPSYHDGGPSEQTCCLRRSVPAIAQSIQLPSRCAFDPSPRVSEGRARPETKRRDFWDRL